MVRTSRTGKPILLAGVLLLAVLSAGTAHADLLKLRRLLTDEEGIFTVLFSLVDNNRDPISDPQRIPLEGIGMVAGEDAATLEPLSIKNPSIMHLRDYANPFRVYILIPNNDLFNGTEDDTRRPDASGLRNALVHALQLAPPRDDVFIRIGVYNETVSWLPEFTSAQVAELSTELMRPRWIADPGTRAENPFNAITLAQRTYLRRGSRESGAFVYFFIVVTSTLTTVESEEFSNEVSRIRELLSGDDMADVITQVIVYRPYTNYDTLNEPGGDPVRFATGVAPPSGTYRLAGSATDVQTAFEQTLDEIWSSFVLRFTNKALEPDINYYFKMSMTPSGGSLLDSNTIRAHVTARKFNLWGLIILIGSILIGLVIIAIVVLFLIKRPKKEVEKEPEPVFEAPKLCVQCGRQLRDDLQYCHHCAAEPNYGLLKVIEGPKSGWTFFLRDIVTEVGKSVGNNIILNDPGISGNHFKVSFQEGGRYLIEDVGSTNGTYIEGQRVQRQFLKNGDVINVGTSTKLKFTIS
ncbi:MAG: FHA domain-containing protein [Bradymonadales bacterium]|nr:FHA domain-containing protein [Bradymonadales bacterium]